MQEAVTTDIIIVSFRVSLKECIKSIKENCSHYTLIIEDNNTINRGFSKAVNDGIKKGRSEYIWLLNPDATVLKGTQQALLNRFKADKKAGIVGSMQLDPSNPDRIAFGGARQAFPYGIHKGGLVSMGHCRFPEKQTWVNGASMMIRRKVIDDIGLLDESMFLLYSDSDYCYSAREAGWTVWYEPSPVLHTLGAASKNTAVWQQRDMEAFMRKWGIKLENGRFIYSKRFWKLDLFP